MLLSEKETKVVCEKLLSCTKADDAEVNVFSDDFHTCVSPPILSLPTAGANRFQPA